MQNPNTSELKSITFGRRKFRPRIYVADGKRHIRQFLVESLEELGFISSECAQASELSAMLAAQIPDLIVMGLSTGGIEAAAMLKALAASAYGGKVLVIGNRDSPAVAAIQELGEQLGIAMLPTLATPFGSAGLHNSVAMLGAVKTPPRPSIDVAEALHAGWLELWYQPKLSIRKLEVCGAEALIRLRHPTWGIVPPASFIPDEGDPYFRLLSNFVIDRAINDWRGFVAQYPGIEIAINLPISFFQDPSAVAGLRHQMPDDPAFKGLTIDLNAGDAIRNLDASTLAARQLRFSNVAVSIDGLGSEWASLVGLRYFPFVEIKVDRQFISGCAENPFKRSICRQILDLADGFGVRTVAMGVENHADFVAAREMGFDMVQGFLFAKPMRAQKFARTTLRHHLTAL